MLINDKGIPVRAAVKHDGRFLHEYTVSLTCVQPGNASSCCPKLCTTIVILAIKGIIAKKSHTCLMSVKPREVQNWDPQTKAMDIMGK